MIIDLILDRKGGVKYVANDFYLELMQYAETWPDMCDPIIKAMDAGSEQDVISELCKYVKEQQWPEVICNYISAVKWLEDDPEHSFRVQVTFPKDRLMDEQGRTEKQPFEFSTWLSFDILTGNDEQEATFKMFSSLWTLAARMGWELWLPLTIELPGHDFKLTMGPKDEQRAREIQTMLERAKKDGKPFRGEVELNPQDYAVSTAK